MPIKEQLFKARMQAIIDVADTLLADMKTRGFNQGDIGRVAKVRADALDRLTA